ncbi:hypothetical protein NPIL_36281 [Nephila pilipes]|uniref:Uncharacterized protein n=1 Tax=Nephila pilipes TaxID=299642 RepID=A0A8X6UM53_NEPPI|nr:hypothetical protein NPIL_36281 [Nephila pilipes]
MERPSRQGRSCHEKNSKHTSPILPSATHLHVEATTNVSDSLINATFKKVADEEIIISYTSNPGVVRLGSNIFWCFWLSTTHFVKTNTTMGPLDKGKSAGKDFFQDQNMILKYHKYICDGDPKTFSSIVEKGPYGNSVTIDKTECVGRIQMRKGRHLRKLEA